ncbi:MAG: type II toxin-antitoxin system Phd/YefM family antitoxin [Acetobacteraceae bacterium]
MNHVSLTELRQNMADHSDRVISDREPPAVALRGGKGNVVVMSEAEPEGWRETVHLLNRPNNAEHIMASVRRAKAGDTRARALLVPK